MRFEEQQRKEHLAKALFVVMSEEETLDLEKTRQRALGHKKDGDIAKQATAVQDRKTTR